MPEYLSTDPNAGTPTDAAPNSGGYLSTDPNAGEPITATPERESAGALTPAIAGGVAASKAVPGVMAGLHTAAKVGGKMAASRVGSVTPAVIATDAALRAARGDVAGAVTSGLGAAAASQIPRALGVIERASAPSVGLMRGAGGRFVPGSGRAGPLLRGANTLSKAAGRVASPLAFGSITWDVGQYVMERANDPDTSPEVREALWRTLGM